MSIKEVYSDRRTVSAPTPASTAIDVGDLSWWDNTNSVAKPATSRTDTGTLAGNQKDFAPLFLGVSNDKRLATETSTGNDSKRVFIPEGIFDCDCASATWEFGDYVGIDRSGTPLNYAQQVIKVLDRQLAIGQVVQREGVATTKVRCFLSAYEFGYYRRPSVSDFAIASADGAVSLKSGTVYITKASAAALTIADPTATVDDGKVLRVIATTAHAHTLSNAAGSGFNAGGAGSDVGTFGGAKGDNIILTAYQGKWYVASSVNVTLA